MADSANNNFYLNRLNELRGYIQGLIKGNNAENDKFDFEFSVLRFMKLKEQYLDKVNIYENNKGYELFFDTFRARNVLWDILFLSEIVKREMNKSPDFTKFVDALRNKRNKVKIYSNNQSSTDVMDSFKNIYADLALNDYYSFEGNLLDVILDAICIFDSMRNAFGHNENGKNCYVHEINGVKYVHIKENSKNNKGSKSYLEFDIELSYFCRFGLGIKPLNKDNDLVSCVDGYHHDVSAILNFSVKDNMDIFYRASPSRINYLLEFVNSDFNKLVDLPSILFSKSVSDERVRLLLSLTDDLELIKRIPSGFFAKKCTDERLKNICLGNIDIDYLANIPNYLFLCSESAFEAYNDLINYGLDLNDVSKIPNGIFNDSSSFEKTKYLLLLDEGKARFDNIFSLPNNFFNSNYRLDKIKMIIKDQNSFGYLSTLPKEVFHCDFAEEKWNYLYANKEKISLLNLLPKEAFKLDCSPERFMFILNTFSKDQLIDIPYYFYLEKCSFDKLKYFVDCFSFDKLVQIPFNFYYCNLSLQEIKRIFNITDDINFISNFPFEFFSSPTRFALMDRLFGLSFDNDTELVKYLSTNNYVLNVINHLPTSIFTNNVIKSKVRQYKSQGEVDNFKKIEYLLKKSDISVLFGLDNFVFSYDFSFETFKFILGKDFNIDLLRKIGEQRYKRIRSLFSSKRINYDLIKKICGDVVDFDLLLKVPMSLSERRVNKKFIDYIFDLFDYNIDLFSKVSPCLFQDFNEEKIKFFVGDNNKISNLYVVPDSCFKQTCSLERIRYIMGKIDNDYSVLNKLPSEIFTCDDVLVDSILNDYSDIGISIKKSILGFDDDLSIAVAFYINSLFGSLDMSDNANKKKLSVVDLAGFDLWAPYSLTVDAKNCLLSKLKDFKDKKTGSLKQDVDVEKELFKLSGIGSFVPSILGMSNTDDRKIAFKEFYNNLDYFLGKILYEANEYTISALRNAFEHVFLDLYILDELNINDLEGKIFNIRDPKFDSISESDKDFDDSRDDLKKIDFRNVVESNSFNSAVRVVDAFKYASNIHSVYYENKDYNCNVDEALKHLFFQVDRIFDYDNFFRIKNECVAKWKKFLVKLYDVIEALEVSTNYELDGLFANSNNFVTISVKEKNTNQVLRFSLENMENLLSIEGVLVENKLDIDKDVLEYSRRK